MPVFPEKSFPMSKEEMAEIALALLRAKIRKDGVRVSLNLVEEIAEKSKDTGIAYDRVVMFIEIMSREVVEEAFANTVSFNPQKKT